MATLLSTYLADAARARSGNCLLFAADWVRLATGYDPARAWRDDRPEVDHDWVDAHGGKRLVARRAMRGFAVVDDPRPGDVALVHVGGHDKLMAAAIVVDRNQFALKTCDFAITIAGAPAIRPLIIWRVPWPIR